MLVKLLLTTTTSSKNDDHAHIADVLTNIARTTDGRRVLLEHHHLPALAGQLKQDGQSGSNGSSDGSSNGSSDGSETRRRGAAAMLRNICLALTVGSGWGSGRLGEGRVVWNE